MADQAPGDETDIQPVTEHFSDPEEIGSKASQDRENIHNPHVDNEKDIEHCDKDFCRQDCTDQTDTRLENQIPPGKCGDNEDTKKNNVTLRAEINSTMASRHSQADEYEDGTGQEATPFPDDIKLHAEIKNEVTEGSQTMKRVAPEHSQADGSLENINTATEASQEDITEEMTRGGSALSVCDVESTSDSSGFTVVLFGNTSAVHLGEENILLGAEHFPPDQAHIPRKIKVSGRALSVVNILDLHENYLSVDSVDHITGQLVNENNIQSFIFVLKLGQFTDDDKMGLEWLERKFGEDVLSFVMILFTYEREEECDTIIDDLKNNTVLEQLVKKCGDRYCTCSKKMNNQSEMRTLLEKIDHLFSENNQHCHTAENYNTELKFKEHQQETGRQKDHSTHLPQEKKVPHISEELTEKGKGKMTESGEDRSKYEEKKKLEMTKREQLFFRLNLNEKHKQKMKTSDILQITSHSLHWKESCTEKDLVETFLQRLLMMDYRARYIATEEEFTDFDHTYLGTGDDDVNMFAEMFSKKAESFNAESHKYRVHPMDVQMAVFHCSDHFLKQLIVNKLAQCQYALPLLVPNPFTREIEFPLWTFRQIRKSWKTTESSGEDISKTQAISEAETPMVAFFRFGSASSSKSQLMNSLINEKHDTFFHRNCPGSSKNRLLLDGVMEIAWYCPSGKETDYFPDCVAFCNLHDKRTSDYLSALHHKYNKKWTAVLDLKKKHDKSDKMKWEQTELEELSEKLNAATFGLEHIFREMGQIYEAFISVQTHKKRSEEKTLTSLPKLAAELMKSGHPMELMDGDAAHVPLIWVSAVLDELVKILGDQRVFVLSVLGIQSSGKSTMLNAMFGLQFAVSAGRCTRGAFMQLVRVSEEMKEELKFDYILIVDTEGLRALELAGKSTRHHDNELATFVVGLGNLTLINIFGENPAEMQDILQIVVQAFLRMKKVRLNPSCMFVHQNVGDITAGEKNMEGRRRLQEKLDEMAKLAAKEEESEAECFSDVIEFNVQDDVYYFAQLWEGSPPMAPPNPCYSRNVQNLKNAIFKKTDKSTSMTLSEFKSRISDLWNALLNENFVFSFQNTLEIAVYRKLENEFGKWTWALRSAMLDTEEKLYNRIENEKLKRIEEKDLFLYMKKTKEEVDKSMKSFFEEDKDKEILIQWRVRCENKITQLYEDLVKDTKQNANEVIRQQCARETFEHKRTQYDEKLFNLSKDLALSLKSKQSDEQVLKQEFDKLWDKWVTELTHDTPSEKATEVWGDVVQILSEGNEQAFVRDRLSQEDFKKIDKLGNYSCYIILNKHKESFAESQHKVKSDVNKDINKGKIKEQPIYQRVWRGFVSYIVPGYGTQNKNQSETNALYSEDQNFVKDLIRNVIQETGVLIREICSKITRLGYKDTYIQEITDHIRKKVEQHHSENKRIKIKKEFTLDLCLHVCELASHSFTECHKQFRDANDPRVYLSKQKPQYYNVFKNYCRGATATKVFGELICSNLRESILQAVYNKTAIDLAAQIRSGMPEFNGNRTNLEKHILKYLAEEENFEKYKEYIHNPKKHFKHFITEKVNKYITENNTTVLKLFKQNLKEKMQRVRNAVHIATEKVKNRRGDADMWLRSFTSSLNDELNLKEITFTDHKEITDFDFLQQLVSEGLTEMMSELDKSFKSVKDIKMEKFRKKPDKILIEHLCRCCWVQCPFCKSICTNTMEDHDGDHSVPFHRVDGINGWYYRGTTNLCSDFCTTAVQSNKSFHPSHDTDEFVPYKSYRRAGGVYATWSITPDNSQLAYWKWFVCRFQKDLERHYENTFQGYGEIPREWRDFNKKQAIKSLDEYI
ncbi:hypothetical protein PHYPO_G00051170 [Pangasianodon hypophthalmus]|uniref:VLIG-type G domain-containing protein n=1 Tax=Pangasianodon hypophthalmus TaxID=310915 RepID=A0A5N5M5F5_PANHP|nr:hypothetical protein PHYPO_G00051170 [Pangasianodon hypophthalmus]